MQEEDTYPPVVNSSIKQLREREHVYEDIKDGVREKRFNSTHQRQLKPEFGFLCSDDDDSNDDQCYDKIYTKFTNNVETV